MEKKKKIFSRNPDLVYYTVLGTILAGVLFFYSFVGFFPRVSGESMMNTLHDGDFMMCRRVKDASKFERFDIVIATMEDGTQIVKRIIGLPGEEVFIDENGNIYINGNILEESYGRERIKDPGRAYQIVTLKENEFFLLGDNRNNSLDSRFEEIGNVPLNRIKGIVVKYKDHSKE